MLDQFPPRRDFHALSVRQLLEARDAFHSHLLHLAHVVGTGIGLYRIRRDELKVDTGDTTRELVRKRDLGEYKAPGPRTLGNSVVKPWSWPCVLVFVDEWCKPEDFAKNPDEMVPRFLYARGDLVVPTCVVLVERDDSFEAPLDLVDAPVPMLGGGLPLFSRVQGQTRVGSVGCLVRDGRNVYAITNQHVAGDAGSEISAVVHGEYRVVGSSSVKQVGKLAFSTAYRGWPGEDAMATLDAGLIEVHDVREWSAQIFGLGELGATVDLNTHTITLDLIGTPVDAFGAGSRRLTGEIQALFYRFRSIGGLDYVADLVIGPRSEKQPLATHHGDSGTLWVWNGAADQRRTPTVGAQDDFRPIALQWGGQRFLDGLTRERYRFALATSLSTICRELDVEVIRDWNIGNTEYWGAVGHYKVGLTACDLLADPDLVALMQANQSRIAITDVGLLAKDEEELDRAHFVPLADVADIVWRVTRKKDQANHFADMDEPGKGQFNGKTLLQLFTSKQSTLNAATWTEFYDALGVDEDKHRGALPLRMKEYYDAMVGFAAAGQLVEFVCAAGTAAHYMGDACQPLHVSRLHHGADESETDVHTDYETTMVGRFRKDIITDVKKKARRIQKKHCYTGGQNAAEHVVALMRNTLKHLPPQDILAVWRTAHGQGKTQKMWDALGARTTDVMARGAEALALFWESAWREGRSRPDAAPVKKTELTAIPEQQLMDLYNDHDGFLPARWLKEM